MSETSECRKDVASFRIFLNDLDALKEEGLPEFLGPDPEGHLHHLFYTVLPSVCPRYLVEPDRITAKQLGHLYATVKSCLEKEVMMYAEEGNSTNAGSWWSTLKIALKGFASAYEQDPYFLQPREDGIRVRYMRPGALVLTLQGRDGANRETTSTCRFSGVEGGKTEVRECVDEYIRKCHSLDIKVRLDSLSRFQQLALTDALEPTWLPSDRDLHQETRKTVEEAYWDSVSTLREPSLCFSIDPDLYSPEGENLTARDSEQLAKWIRRKLIPSLEAVARDVQNQTWPLQVKWRKIAIAEALQNSAALGRLAMFKDGDSVSKVRDLQGLYAIVSSSFAPKSDGQSVFWEAKEAQPGLWARASADDEMASNWAWLRSFLRAVVRPTIDINAYRKAPGCDDLLLVTCASAGATTGANSHKNRSNGLILSVHEASLEESISPQSSTYSNFATICGLKAQDIDSIINCLNTAERSIKSSRAGPQNDDEEKTEQICRFLSRTVSAFECTKSELGKVAPDTDGSIITSSTDVSKPATLYQKR